MHIIFYLAFAVHLLRRLLPLPAADYGDRLAYYCAPDTADGDQILAAYDAWLRPLSERERELYSGAPVSPPCYAMRTLRCPDGSVIKVCLN